MKKVRITTDYAGCSYITPGKVYEVEISIETDRCMFGYAMLDDRMRSYLSVKHPEGCAFIGGNHWTILPDEPAEPQIDHAEELAKALEACSKVFEELFCHCLSNGVYNAWSKRLDCTNLNNAMQITDRTLTNYRSAKK